MEKNSLVPTKKKLNEDISDDRKKQTQKKSQPPLEIFMNK